MGPKSITAATLLFAASMLWPSSAMAQFGFDLSLGQGSGEAVEFDLGNRAAGEIYEIDLEAINENCNQPQDFQFDLSNIPWLQALTDDTVRGLRAGERGSIVAVVDLTNVSPGEYEGIAEVHCATCQVLIFNTCNIDRRELTFLMNVQPMNLASGDETLEEQSEDFGTAQADVVDDNQSPASRPADQGTSTSSDATPTAVVVGGTSSSGRASNAATRAAYAEMSRLAALKDPCAEELARLRAAAAAAAAAAATAAADAAQAETDAAAAEQHLADFQDEMDAAQRAMDSTYRTLQMQAAYRTIVGGESGTGSERYAEADQLVDDANDAAVEAQRNFSNIRSSYDARAAAAEAARQNATDKAAAAAAAQAAANAAAAAVTAKELECQNLAQSCIDAQQAAADAQAQADQDAADEQARIEREAAAAAAQRQLDAVRARNACNACLEQLRHRSHTLTKAFQAMRDNGMINPNEVSDDDVDLEGIVVEGYIAILADGVATAVGTPTLQVFTMLDALSAAYGIYAIANAAHVPGQMGYRGDDQMKDWLQGQGHAENPQEAAEVLRAIEEFQNHNGNTEYLREQWERETARCERLCRRADEAEAAAVEDE